MILKNKNKALFVIISIYCIGLFMSFFGDLLFEFQSVRHQSQIEKIEKREVLEFTIKEWKSFNDNKEIKYKNEFYDVVSYEKVKSKIIATVVKDRFENEIRITISKIFSKHKTPFSDKKKSSVFSKHIVQEFQIISSLKPEFLDYKPSYFDAVFDLKIKSFINLFQKPPC